MSRSRAVATAPLGLALPEDPGVRAVFSGRDDVGNLSRVVGGGDVAVARRELVAQAGLPAERAVFMEQVHGAAVAEVGAWDAGRGLDSHDDAVGGVDALVSRATDLALVVMVADCVPVLLALPGRAVGVAHAGRQGVQEGIVPAAVQALCEVGGGQVGDVVAIIGPAIGGCCYELPAAMAAELAEACPATAARTRWGSTAGDLPAGVAAQLGGIGVGRVEQAGSCTRCESNRWFSHRATSASESVPAGRQAGLIARVSAAPPTPPGSIDSRLS